jgi:peptidoglycan/xylan/chitin deacetylase (PgdA/CDA1 family)
MSRRTTNLLKAALSALHYTGAGSLLKPLTRGSGVVFMLHHVRPEAPQAFEPNRILKVTPGFLETVIGEVLEQGFEVISLDEVAERLTGTGGGRPFACFTFDDGYRDNRDYAYPVFKRYKLPFAIYVPAAFADGAGDLWWLTLEAALRRLERVVLDMGGAERRFLTGTRAEKERAFHDIYWWLRTIPEGQARAAVARLAKEAAYDPAPLAAQLLMTWDEIRELAQDPLVTIGAHTVHHYALAKLPEAEARSEIAAGVARIETELGRPCRHLSYPYGDELSAGEREFRLARELGLATAVTTRKGLIHAHHASQPTALPRVSLNGDYQNALYVRVLLTGAPFAFWRGLRPPFAGTCRERPISCRRRS